MIEQLAWALYYFDRNFKADDVHVAGLRNIAKACSESASVTRLIHVSPATASLTSQSTIMKSRAEGERLLREEFPKTVIVRSSSLFGHEDRFLRAIGGTNKKAYVNVYKATTVLF